MTTSEELAHLLFAQLADPNRTESDLTLITRMMDSVTQERDEWQVKARWKHTHDDSWDGKEPHVHAHQHLPLRHAHPHYPDIHHRHDHS